VRGEENPRNQFFLSHISWRTYSTFGRQYLPSLPAAALRKARDFLAGLARARKAATKYRTLAAFRGQVIDKDSDLQHEKKS
jgi:hypothetical protein